MDPGADGAGLTGGTWFPYVSLCAAWLAAAQGKHCAMFQNEQAEGQHPQKPRRLHQRR